MHFSHIWREGNRCFDALAKMGTENVTTLRIWDTPLEGILCLLADDSEGKTFIRVQFLFLLFIFIFILHQKKTSLLKIRLG